MGTFPLLDTFLGLAFVYLLLALVCTTVMEWIAQLLNMRGKTLVRGTQDLLGEADIKDRPFTDSLFQHGLIRSLGKENRTPSYLPSGIFAKALRDLLIQTQPRAKVVGDSLRAGPEAAKSATPPKLTESLRALQPSGSARSVNALRADEQSEPDNLRSEQSLAEWYDRAMERVSGTYKRRTRTIIFWLAVSVTVAMNANTVALVSTLWQSPALRGVLIEHAKTRLEQGPPLQTVEYTEPLNPQPTPPVATGSSKSPNGVTEEEQTLLGQLFGWQPLVSQWNSARGTVPTLLLVLATLGGWAITALAVSLGAPFWFDTLNRFMKLRSTGDVPPKTTNPV